MSPGDTVCVLPSFPVTDYGVLADHALVPAAALVPRPKGLGAEEAALVWMGFATAYGGLVSHGGLREGAGEAVLISAAASSASTSSGISSSGPISGRRPVPTSCRASRTAPTGP